MFGRNSLGLSNLGELTRAICEAAARGLQGLGVAAAFRPRSDIEVDGRKLCGTGGYFDGDTLFYQGSLLIDLDPAAMMAALNVPEAKLAKRDLDSAAQRVTTLRALLGDQLPELPVIQDALLAGFAEGLGIAPRRGAITAAEEALAQRIHDETIGTEAFVTEIDDPGAGDDVLSESRAGPGGTVTAYLRLEGPARNRVREVLLTGDFFATPPRLVFDLEASLRGLPVDELGAAVDRFFEAATVDLLTIQPADFREVILAAAGH